MEFAFHAVRVERGWLRFLERIPVCTSSVHLRLTEATVEDPVEFSLMLGQLLVNRIIAVDLILNGTLGLRHLHDLLPHGTHCITKSFRLGLRGCPLHSDEFFAVEEALRRPPGCLESFHLEMDWIPLSDHLLPTLLLLRPSYRLTLTVSMCDVASPGYAALGQHARSHDWQLMLE